MADETVLHKPVLKIAIYGYSGSGKTTASRIILDHCRKQNFSTHFIKLTDPFYEAQYAIYKIAGKELDNFYKQDGEILSFLGLCMRRIDPNVVSDKFSYRLSEELRQFHGSALQKCLIICDDMRHPDCEFLKKFGFVFFRIVADEQLRIQRRIQRGDNAFASTLHPLEQGVETIVPDFIVENNNSLSEFHQKILGIMDGLVSRYF